MVTTDHGMFQYGHGGNQFTVREAWGIAAGGQVEDLDGAAGREWRPVDVAASALAHVGIELDPEWNLDGIPVWEESTDPFDTVKEFLQPAKDEPAKPRDLLGWTKQTPEGWEIEENTPDKGVTEYRGWNFMTGPFWVTTEGGQGREGFVRGRDVIAVADPDEWNDIGSPSVGGEYLDSTLWSPVTPVDAGGKVEVTYQHHYRQVQRASDPQTATVIAQWDTGEETVLWRKDQSEGSVQEVSQVKNLEAIAPEGATSVRIGWHMFGANNFYWAIDHPIIEVEYTEVVAEPSVAEAMDPATGSVAGGTKVTLTGTGFDGATGVEFGGVAGTDFTVVDDSTITVTAPANEAGEVEVIVVDVAGNSDPLTFTYTGDDNGDDDDDDNTGGGLHDLVKKIVNAVVDLIKKLFGGLFGR